MGVRDWQPRVEGAMADEVWRSIHAIAEGILSRPDILGTDPGTPAELAGGLSGTALFLTYLALATGEERFADATDDLLVRCIEHVGRQSDAPPFLMGGYVGTAWAIDHIARRFDAEDDLVEQIDHVLRKVSRHTPWKRTYDLLGGLVGYAMYALDRLPRPPAREILGSILDHLDALHSRVDGGVTWRTEPWMMVAGEEDHHPDGYYNLGVAHGIPGILGVLGPMAGHGIDPERSGRLFREGARWLRGLALEGSVPTYGESLDRMHTSTRLAWCYGDPGTAAALWSAADAAGDRPTRDFAETLARHVAPRVEGAGVQDASLCHGSAGLVAINLRFHHWTGDPVFAEAARAWVRHTLDHRRPEGIAGFPARRGARGGPTTWEEDPGFLTGAAGVGLALLAAVTDVEPNWDRCLLLSARRRSA